MSKRKEGERKENDPVLFFRFQGTLTRGTEQNFTRGRGVGGGGAPSRGATPNPFIHQF